MTEENPYAHISSVSETPPDNETPIYPDASNRKRFAHYMLDPIFCYSLILVFLALVNISATNNDDVSGGLSELTENLFSVGLYLGYFIFFEGLFGITPAKLITGCRVVHVDTHKKPGMISIFARTICRLIPFEHFSFFGSRPGGWHDRLSKTRVIDKRKETFTHEEYADMRRFTI